MKNVCKILVAILAPLSLAVVTLLGLLSLQIVHHDYYATPRKHDWD